MDKNDDCIEYPFEETGGIGDENRIRGNWSSKIDYFLSIFGLNLAFGNFWQFACKCSTSGGAVYFITYSIMFLLIALPIYFVETSLGQFSNLGAISIWKLSPIFKGIGISMVVVAGIISITLSMVIAWALYYMNNSLRSSLQWTSCGNDWNTENCTVLNKGTAEVCTLLNGVVLANGSCMNYNLNVTEAQNMTQSEVSQLEGVLSSIEYFEGHVLLTNSINWQLAICLFMAWLFIFVSLFKGIKTSGKVVYVTTTVPYFILLALLVRLLTLSGSFDGLVYFLTPDWNRLYDFRVWGDSAIQVFSSMSGCIGTLIVLASYNRFHNNVFRDVWVISIVNILTTIFITCIIFSAVGFFCFQLNITPDHFHLQEGIRAMIVFFSTVLSKLPVPNLFSFLFFGLIAFAIFNAELFLVETIVSSICDEFPEQLRRKHRKVLSVVLVAFYILGAPLCSSIGIYWLSLIEGFSSTSTLLIIAFLQVIVVSWVYGVDNFLDNVKWMCDSYPPFYIFWKFLWKFICPLILLLVLSYAWLITNPQRDLDQFPFWVISIGWAIALLPIIIVLIVGTYKFCTARGKFTRRWRDLLNPEGDWGPALAVHRAEQFPMQIPEARKLMPYADIYYSGINGSNGVLEVEQFIDRHSRSSIPPEAYSQQFFDKSAVRGSEKETTL